MRYCGHCHECGTEMTKHLDGEEWCSFCGAYRRYRSHGWSKSPGSRNFCPNPRVWDVLDLIRDEFLPRDAWGSYAYQLTEMIAKNPESHDVDLADDLIESIYIDRASMGYY